MLPKAFAVVLNLLESSGKQNTGADFLWLVRLREHWLFCWKKDSYPSAQDPDQQEKLAERDDFVAIGQSAVLQQRFIRNVQAWAKAKWKQHLWVGDWVLPAILGQPVSLLLD